MYAQTIRKQVRLSPIPRALLLAALAVMVWMLIPAQAAWADCGDTNPTVLCVDADATSTPHNGLTWTNAYTKTSRTPWQ